MSVLEQVAHIDHSGIFISDAMDLIFILIALFVGGIIQPNRSASAVDITTKDINVFEESPIDSIYSLKYTANLDKFEWKQRTIRIDRPIR